MSSRKIGSWLLAASNLHQIRKLKKMADRIHWETGKQENRNHKNIPTHEYWYITRGFITIPSYHANHDGITAIMIGSDTYSGRL